jgi:6-pyruvoyltetrahydropterin/6-carboxytetrahydropterin synthase
MKMNVTTFKRFEFSAARHWDEGRWDGSNYIGWAGVTGPLDVATGMVVNVTDLKQWLNLALEGFDHRALTDEPTTLNVARALRQAVKNELPTGLALASLELQEWEGDGALLTPKAEAHILTFGFSAAHRTHAPRLSAAENARLYGRCNNPAGHGHNYRVEISLPAHCTPDPALWRPVWEQLDHRNLSQDVPEFADRNVVTEAVARYIAERLPEAERVRVWETADFFAEYLPVNDLYRLGRRYRFSAAHRLHSPQLSDEANRRLYGKCNRPEPHGHNYRVEVVVQSSLDARTETAYDLGCLDSEVGQVLGELDRVYLDQAVPEFWRRPSTGENIAAYLHRELMPRLGRSLAEVRLWETPNNRFVVRESAA